MKDAIHRLLDRSFDVPQRLTNLPNGRLRRLSNSEYDGLKRRIFKSVSSPASVSHRYYYNGWNPVIERVQSSGGTTSTVRYVWGKDLSGTLQGAGGVGGLLATQVGGAWYFPAYDANGNITQYVDEDGHVVASYAYDAFGNTVAQSGAMAGVFPFRFSTKYYDAESGLYYYGYRFYSPEFGRWMNRDPIEEDGGVNLYAFCGNDGVERCDTDGSHWVGGLPIEYPEGYDERRLYRPYDEPDFDAARMNMYAALKTQLESKCPKPWQKIRVKCTDGKQCCSGSLCRQQADVIARKYSEVMTAGAKQQYLCHGNVLGGWQGNIRYHVGMRKWKDSALCFMWANESFQTVHDVLASYSKTKSRCFTVDRVSKGRENGVFVNQHDWVIVFGPYDQPVSIRNFDRGVILDPWPSGGLYLYEGKNRVPERICKEADWKVENED